MYVYTSSVYVFINCKCMSSYSTSHFLPSLGIPLKSDKKEVVESCVRFSEKERGHPTVEVTDTAFSVNRAIQLHGVTVYGGTGSEYKYTLSILAVCLT